MSFGPQRAIRARAFLCSLIAAAAPGLGCGREPAPHSGARSPELEVQDSAPAAGSLAQAPFEARRERPLDAKPAGICAADFDGDGHDDLALTFLVPGGSLVLRGETSGLARVGERRACGDYPLAPLALPRARFGAGERERRIAVCSRSARVLEIVPAFAASGVSAAIAHFTLDHAPRALATGVLQGRGVIAVACDDKRLEVLREGATELEHWTVSGLVPRCALVSEELGAVLVGFQDSMTVEAYTSAEAPPLGRLTLSGFPRDMAIIDADGDGHLDLAVAGGERELWFARSDAPDGARRWFEPGAVSTRTTGAIPLQLAVADFDADGRGDLAVLHHYDLSVRTLCKLSATGAGTENSLYVGQTPIGVAALDVDGDGRQDLAIANRDTQGLGLISGDGSGGFQVGATIALGEFPNALAATPREFANSSALRLVALNVKSNTASAVALRDGKLCAVSDVQVGDQPRAPLIAELDGVPGLDVLFLGTNPRGAQLAMLHGDPTGSLSSGPVLEIGGAASDLALLDVDGDGKPELALCDPTNGTVTLCEAAAARCEGTGLQGAAHLAVPSAPCALAAIELDGDPASELACVLTAPGERTGIAWLDARRKKTGELELALIGFTKLPDCPIDAVACDLDGDGRQDLAVLSLATPTATAGSWCALLRGPGAAGDFRVAGTFPTGQRPHRIAAADVDGDGRAEVFVAAQDSHLVNAWTCAGAKGQPFAMRAWDDLGAGRGPLDLAVTDADGDGRADLCVVNGFSNDVTVLHGLAGVKAK